jgi:hypothetical protein
MSEAKLLPECKADRVSVGHKVLSRATTAVVSASTCGRNLVPKMRTVYRLMALRNRSLKLFGRNRSNGEDVVPARRFDLAEIEVSPRARLIVFVEN